MHSWRQIRSCPQSPPRQSWVEIIDASQLGLSPWCVTGQIIKSLTNIHQLSQNLWPIGSSWECSACHHKRWRWCYWPGKELHYIHQNIECSRSILPLGIHSKIRWQSARLLAMYRRFRLPVHRHPHLACRRPHHLPVSIFKDVIRNRSSKRTMQLCKRVETYRNGRRELLIIVGGVISNGLGHQRRARESITPRIGRDAEDELTGVKALLE